MSKILSVFDGMACGYIAMILAGEEIDRYVAYEIDKYAVQTSSHNFKNIEHKGDVFNADFKEYEGFDFLVGGSPCTYWSIAQTKNRETVASGMGWELFSQYVRALRESKPKYFIYENNKSMSAAIRESISETFGFEPVLINSALVSAQNRQRLYWVGIRNEDGTYRKVNVEQPEDRCILLKDILDGGRGSSDREEVQALSEKSHAVISSAGRTTEREYFTRSQGDMVAEPVRIPPYGDENKSRPVNALYPSHAGTGEGSLEQRMFSDNPSKQQVDLVAEPVCCNPKVDGVQPSLQDRIYSVGGEMTAVTTAFHPNVAEPVNVTSDGKSHTIKAQYYKNGTANFISNDGFDATAVAVPICVTEDGKSRTLIAQYGAKQGTLNIIGATGFGSSGVAEQIRVGALPRPNGELSTSQAFKIYSQDGKSATLCANGGGSGGKTGLYALRVGTYPSPDGTLKDGQAMRIYDSDGKAVPITTGQTKTGFYVIRVMDGREQKLPIYKVENGQIEIKGRLYPIKLDDGFYIIRKLTVSECMRLQTVPDWYEFPVSNTQAYKMLGNGWTCEVIVHLINSIRKEDVSNGRHS